MNTTNPRLTHRSQQPMHTGQRGVILVTALILLLVMTMIGVTALQTTTMEERMSGATEDLNRAFQAAEAALRKGEDLLNGANEPVTDGTEKGLYDSTTVDTTNDPLWELADTWTNGAISYDADGEQLGGVGNQPNFIVERLNSVAQGNSRDAGGAQQESSFFRVTTRATGSDDNTVVMLQSTYKR